MLAYTRDWEWSASESVIPLSCVSVTQARRRHVVCHARRDVRAVSAGPPQLMMSFTADGQLDPQLLAQRDSMASVDSGARGRVLSWARVVSDIMRAVKDILTRGKRDGSTVASMVLQATHLRRVPNSGALDLYS